MDTTSLDNGVDHDDGVVVELDGCVRLVIDTALYSKTTVMKAAHKFTGLCHTQLNQSQERSIIVRLLPKAAATDVKMLGRDFLNEVLDQGLREQIQAKTRDVRNLILAHAFSDTTILHPEFETEEPPAP